jgi:putative transposase
MARPLRLEGSGVLYHVIVRGNERKSVFRDDADRETYLARLAHYRDEFNFKLFAYCLMTNHVHLAIQRGPVALSRIMHAVQSTYTQRFNHRHDRAGHLFQGRYKAFVVQKDRYLLALLRYIHENPVRARIVKRPQDFPWSSDRFYRSGRGPDWLDLDAVSPMLGRTRSAAVARYQSLMKDAAGPTYEDLKTHSGVVRGDEDYSDRILAEADQAPVPRRLAWTGEKLARAVGQALEVSLTEMKSPSRRRAISSARILAGYLGRTDAGISVARMARLFGRDESTLVRGVLALERKLAGNRELAKSVNALRRAL